jgi:glycosyltransferase involved in cell wall biosynthesis
MNDPEVIVNGRALSRRTTGVERCTAEILRCLGERVQIVRPVRDVQGIAGHAWEQFSLPRRVPVGSILWSPANSGPLATHNQVLSLHDLTPLEHPEWFKPTYAAWYRWFLPRLVQRVRRIITPSENVRQKILSRFRLPGDRVVAIPAGVDTTRFHKVVPDGSGGPGRYILFVGTLEPRKNLPTLLAAWQQIEKIHPEVSLVLAGGTGRVFSPVTFAPDIARVKFTGYVAEEDLPGLYSGAEVFVCPSFDEGFGLPVLEAMACGTPVVASACGALPEVVGQAGLFFDPQHADGLARALNDCLTDAHLRQALVENGLQQAQRFSWQAASEQVYAVLRENYAT